MRPDTEGAKQPRKQMPEDIIWRYWLRRFQKNIVHQGRVEYHVKQKLYVDRGFN